MKHSMKRMSIGLALLLPVSAFAANICFTNAPNARLVQIGQGTPPQHKAMKLVCTEQGILRTVADGQLGTFVYDNLPKGTTLFLSWQSGNVWETIPNPIVVGNTDAGYTISYERVNVPMVRRIAYQDCVTGNIRY